MTRAEIESLLHPAPTEHPGWSSFCDVMKERAYGDDPLGQAWAFFSKGWERGCRSLMVTHAYETVALEEALRIAMAIRDDARASSQKYLDEKRQAEARADIFEEEADLWKDLRDGLAVDGYTVSEALRIFRAALEK